MKLRSTTPIATLLSDFDREIPELCREQGVPGLALALVQNGVLAATWEYGIRHVETGETVDSGTVFQGASLSKPVFALGVRRLCERGMLDLDRPLREYLSEAYAPGDSQIDRITARQVLSHQTGLPNWRPDGQDLVTLRPPGAGFGYSGEGYVYLQRVVERLMGLSLESYIGSAVLGPLGMLASHYVWIDRYDTIAAIGYQADGTAVHPQRAEPGNAAYSLHTTAADFARLILATLSADLGEWLRPQVQLTQDSALAWGLGWGLQTTSDGLAFWHWGDNRGFKDFAIGFPDARFGIVVLTNGDNGRLVYERVLREIVGGEYPGLPHLNGMRLKS
jgi:CubicO group peptidase (beta-lactamase class C family)